MYIQRSLVFPALMDDVYSCQQILDSRNPREMKRLGRAVRDMNYGLWKEHSIDVVRNGNIAKVHAHT